MGVNFHPKHDHEAIEDKDKNEDKVGDVSESAPNGENGEEVLETKTGALGICWLDDAVATDVVADRGEILTKGNGGRGVGLAKNIAKLTEDTITAD